LAIDLQSNRYKEKGGRRLLHIFTTGGKRQGKSVNHGFHELTCGWMRKRRGGFADIQALTMRDKKGMGATTSTKRGRGESPFDIMRGEARGKDP